MLGYPSEAFRSPPFDTSLVRLVIGVARRFSGQHGVNKLFLVVGRQMREGVNDEEVLFVTAIVAQDCLRIECVFAHQWVRWWKRNACEVNSKAAKDRPLPCSYALNHIGSTGRLDGAQ